MNANARMTKRAAHTIHFAMTLQSIQSCGNIELPTVPIKCVKDGHTCEADGSFLNFDLYCALGQMCTCQAKNEIAKNTFEIAPYLYPFTIEFNILIGIAPVNCS